MGWTARALLATAGRHEHCNPMALRGPPRYDRVGAHESLRSWLPELLASLEAEQTRSSVKKSAKVVIITYALFAFLSGIPIAFGWPSMSAVNRLRLCLQILAGPFGVFALLWPYQRTPVGGAALYLLLWFVVCGALIGPSFIWRYAILRVIAVVGVALWLLAGWITLGAY